MRIHLISGEIASGKDTFFQNRDWFNIVDNDGNEIDVSFSSAHRFAFADAAKMEMFGTISISREIKEEKRSEIIKYAQDKKKEDPFHWARIVYNEIVEKGCEEVVITDWRYPEEKEFLEENGAECIGYKIYSNFSSENEKDITETSLDKIKMDRYVFRKNFYSFPDEVNGYILSSSQKLKKSDGNAGYDICSIEDVIIPFKSSEIVSTGIRIAMVCNNYYIEIKPRSGLGFNHDVFPLNGIIDPSFRGEIKVKLFNFSEKDYYVSSGDRVAQLIAFSPVKIGNLIPVEVLPPSSRGERGFGSSGK